MTGVRRITVVGWDGRPPGEDAVAALAGATLVLGGRRHLDAVAHLLAPGVPTVMLGDVHAGIRELSAHLAAGGGPAVVLASGDPGFFGVLGTLTRALTLTPTRCADARPGPYGETTAGERREDERCINRRCPDGGPHVGSDTGPHGGLDTGPGSGPDAGRSVDVKIDVLPAMSSVTLAFARAGLPWTDAAVVSAHGRQLRRAANVCRANPLVAVLTGPGAGPAALGAALAGLPRWLFVAENLGLPGERTSWCTPEEAVARPDWREPNVVVAVATGSTNGPPPASPGSGADIVTTPDESDHESGGGSDSYDFHFYRHLFDRDGVRARTSRDLRQNPSPGPADHASPSRGPADLDSTFPLTFPGLSDSDRAAPGPAFHGAAETGQAFPSLAGSVPVPWMFPRRSSPPGWALAEDAFNHRDSMITKMEVRALALARLGPGPGDLVWDVGAGSGSVAVECAAFGAAVVAVDRSADAIGTVVANAAARRVSVQVVHGEAPAVLADLPDPDAVFVGGGGPEVTAACAARGPRVVVVALAAVDRVRPTWEALAAAGMDVDGTQLAASRLRRLPDNGLRLAATNPVTLVWGERRA
jgi:precorrin-6Y C5,15-methyltransferase (decarboxylating)